MWTSKRTVFTHFRPVSHKGSLGVVGVVVGAVVVVGVVVVGVVVAWFEEEEEAPREEGGGANAANKFAYSIIFFTYFDKSFFLSVADTQ